MSLKVKFVGAVGTVTGSCSLLHYEKSDSYYLVDCGLYQGFPGDEERNRRDFDFDPKRLSAVFLTHAHIDHCGLLPKLIADGFKGKVICTRSTAKFTMIALADSARHEGAPYSSSHVQLLKDRFECPDDRDDFKFGYFYPAASDFFYSFIRTAHIVGSVAIQFRINTTTKDQLTLVFSGDIGTCVDGKVHGGLQKARQYPVPETQYLVSESTYGGKVRPENAGTFDERTEALAGMLNRAFAKGDDAVVVIPSFSLQRAQDLAVDIAYVLDNLVDPWASESTPTVIIDSGMAREHAKTMLEEFQRIDSRGKRRFLNLDSPLFAEMNSDQISKYLAESLASGSSPKVFELDGRKWGIVYAAFKSVTLPAGPKIVVASSGNCMGGPVLDHLVQNIKNPKATIAFSGYIPTNSPVYHLKSISPTTSEDRESLKFKIGTTEFKRSEVAATIEDLSSFYSGHADESGLIDFILRRDTDKPTPPLTVFLNHGDQRSRESLKARLLETSSSDELRWRKLDKVIIPEIQNGWFNLVSGNWESPASSTALLDGRLSALELKMETILVNQEAILRLLKSLEDRNSGQ